METPIQVAMVQQQPVNNQQHNNNNNQNTKCIRIRIHFSLFILKLNSTA
jgi:hypothetical protein